MSEEDERILLERVVQALRGHGLTVSVRTQGSFPAGNRQAVWLSVGKHVDVADYAAQFRRRLTPATLGAVVAQLRRPIDVREPSPLLLSDYVTPQLAEQLREQGQQFVDTAGNAYLDGRALFVFVSGRKLHPKQLALRASSGFSSTRLKVLFALICAPELAAAPYRQIAAAADVALGALPAVVADLRQQGALLVNGKQRSLVSSKQLLDEWAQGYALGLRGKTLSERYLAQNYDGWRSWQLNPAHTRWGGEAAALLLGEASGSPGQRAPGVLTLYGDKLSARLLAEQGLEVAGPAAYERLVELRKPFWGQSLTDADDSVTVPPALVYADLLATGNVDCIDAAELIYHTLLVKRFPPA